MNKLTERNQFLDEIEEILNKLWVTNVMKRSSVPGDHGWYLYVPTEKADLAPGGPYETYEEHKKRTSKLN